MRDAVVPTMEPIRRMLGTPADLLFCHAGRVDGYVLEGHVPAAAIRRLLAERPTAAAACSSSGASSAMVSISG